MMENTGTIEEFLKDIKFRTSINGANRDDVYACLEDVKQMHKEEVANIQKQYEQELQKVQQESGKGNQQAEEVAKKLAEATAITAQLQSEKMQLLESNKILKENLNDMNAQLAQKKDSVKVTSEEEVKKEKDREERIMLLQKQLENIKTAYEEERNNFEIEKKTFENDRLAFEEEREQLIADREDLLDRLEEAEISLQNQEVKSDRIMQPVIQSNTSEEERRILENALSYARDLEKQLSHEQELRTQEEEKRKRAEEELSAEQDEKIQVEVMLQDEQNSRLDLEAVLREQQEAYQALQSKIGIFKQILAEQNAVDIINDNTMNQDPDPILEDFDFGDSAYINSLSEEDKRVLARALQKH